MYFDAVLTDLGTLIIVISFFQIYRFQDDDVIFRKKGYGQCTELPFPFPCSDKKMAADFLTRQFKILQNPMTYDLERDILQVLHQGGKYLLLNKPSKCPLSPQTEEQKLYVCVRQTKPIAF